MFSRFRSLAPSPLDERSALNGQRNSASVPNSVSAMQQETVSRTERSKVSASEKQCHLRCLRFCEKQCRRHAEYLLINFISDARRKSLFYLRKPTVLPAQTRFAATTPWPFIGSRASELTPKSFGSLRRQIIDQTWVVRGLVAKSRRNTIFQFLGRSPKPFIGFPVHTARPSWEWCGQRSYPPEP
jgi:hypothetical protein